MLGIDVRDRRAGSLRVGVGLACALVLAGVVRRTWAEDPPAPPDPLVVKVVELEGLVAKHAKDKASQALLLDAKAAVALHKEVAARDDLRKRALGLLDAILKAVKEDGEKKTVLESVGATGDLEGAKIVKPFLRQPNPKEAPPLLVPAIKVAGLLPASELVELLLGFVDDSREMAVSSAAMEALGAFGKVKSKREKVLVTLVKILKPLQPGGVARPKSTGNGSLDPGDTSSGSTNGEGSAAARWTTLSPLLPTTLNRLTGQNLPSALQWIQVVNDAKDPGKLFADK